MRVGMCSLVGGVLYCPMMITLMHLPSRATPCADKIWRPELRAWLGGGHWTVALLLDGYGCGCLVVVVLLLC